MIGRSADACTHAIDVHGRRIELDDETSADVELDPDPDEIEYGTGRRAERLRTVAAAVRGFGGVR